MKKAITFLADGFEEVEAVTPIDYLRRAGIDVLVASIGSEKTVTGARGRIPLIADITLQELKKQGSLKQELWDCVFIPGGMPGAANIAACAPVGAFIKEMANAGKLVGAICASPAIVLAPLGILQGKRFTCYPGMEKKVQTGIWQQDRVVIDGNIITSRAAGTSGEFALALIQELVGSEEAAKQKEALLV